MSDGVRARRAEEHERQWALGRGVALAALFWAVAPAPVQGQVLHVWPSALPPCDGTLQACIDAAGPADAIRIASNGPIDEDLVEEGSLSLSAATGFTPVVTGVLTVFADTAGDHTIRIQGLTFSGGRIDVGNRGPGTLQLEVLDNTIEGAPGDFTATLRISAIGTGPVVATVTGNHVVPEIDVEPVILLDAGSFLSGVIADNVIEMAPRNDAVAMSFHVGGALVMDVVRNRVTGAGYGAGIRIEPLDDEGVFDLRVLGNLLSGGLEFGVGIQTLEGRPADGVRDLLIAHNTVDGYDVGVLLDDADAELVNNAWTHLRFGLAEGSGSDLDLRSNLYFGNQSNATPGFSVGDDPVVGDPLYAGPGDFRLLAGSAAIDAGDPTGTPPELTTDLDGKPRLQGDGVDIGAYEAPEPSAAAALLAAGSALAALACRGRHVDQDDRRTRSTTPGRSNAAGSSTSPETRTNAAPSRPSCTAAAWSRAM
jgi:hypothetical protein